MSGSAPPASEPLLFVGSGLVHPGPLLRARVFRLIRRGRPVSGAVWLADAPREVTSSHYTTIVAFFHHRRNAERIVDTFREFVEHGGVLIALHGVLASFKGNERWEELIGVRFSGHAPPGRLSISPTPGATRAGLSFPELQLYDEQYQFSPVSDTTVLATSDGGGNPVPTFWYRDHGDGRVISLSLGHGRRSVRSNAFRTLLDAALDLGSRVK